MAITITAKKIDNALGHYERKVVSRGESKVKKARQLKELTEDKKSAKVITKEEEVINIPSGSVKTEFLQGAVYSLHINLFEDSSSGAANDLTIHQALSLGELKKISSHITVAEGADSFYDQAVTHSELNIHSAAYTQPPTGTVTLANIANMAVATKLFPDLEYEFSAQNHSNGLNVSSFANYIKTTWLSANLPSGVTIDQSKINIL